MKWVEERMMKQWRNGIKIKFQKAICRKRNRNSDRTKAPSLGARDS